MTLDILTKKCYKSRCNKLHWGLNNNVWRIILNNKVWLDCYWNKLQSFCGGNHHWAHNHADVYCVITVNHQNMEVSVSLNTSFFCFEKLLLKWMRRFLWNNHLWAYNHIDAFYVMMSSKQGNFYLFEWWLPLLIW